MRLSECALQALTELATSRGVQFEAEDGYAAKQRLGTRAMTKRSSDRAQSERRKLNLVTTHTFAMTTASTCNSTPTLPQHRHSRVASALAQQRIHRLAKTHPPRTCPATTRVTKPRQPHHPTYPRYSLWHRFPPCRAQQYRRRDCRRTSSRSRARLSMLRLSISSRETRLCIHVPQHQLISPLQTPQATPNTELETMRYSDDGSALARRRRVQGKGCRKAH